ncbi:MAG TPA: serine/threonine-protein phosphatase [candidate division WOR-3 bacterium]|uniref:Serine/threonine-protein phosphatase n=1 Tax=candidate division WOR-3 bacterium TaxID=2052148 RepID=A0A7V0T5R7_UNCW3|nr:serine/threonine-protein phosphatase [candidate division WOR-3 bacterium]
MRVRVEALSDVGRVRPGNEDACLTEKEARLVAVCDGMGGHAKGEVASAMAVETLRRLALERPLKVLDSALPTADGIPSAAAELVAAVRLAHARIYATATALTDHHGMGTTVAAVRFGNDGSLAVVNVGDSRVYRFRDGTLSQLTRDHTFVSDLLEDNEITEEQARSFGQKNVLSRSLGTAPSVKVDLRLDTALTGDLYLLCTDGLTGPLDDARSPGWPPVTAKTCRAWPGNWSKRRTAGAGRTTSPSCWRMSRSRRWSNRRHRSSWNSPIPMSSSGCARRRSGGCSRCRPRSRSDCPG